MSATRALLCCRISGPEGPSGFGFELTFRLKREDSDSSPPTWPAELMQGLARYVFQTGNILCPGDHVSWHVPLDNGESRLQHMLMAEDPQMSPVVSQCGKTQFVQIVGVCLEELKAAQQWNGPGVLELLMKHTV
jgi:suppressor of fused-like protein